MVRKSILTTMGLVITSLAITSISRADIITYLDKNRQGEGNKGLSYRPLDEYANPAYFTMTARSSIDMGNPFDSDASGSLGTVYIDDHGAGVQSESKEGSKGISGKGKHGNEELIFTFDGPVAVSDIILGIIDIEFGTTCHDGDDDDHKDEKDNPVIFLSEAGSNIFAYTILEDEIENAFSYNDHSDDKGIVDFSLFTSLSNDLMIDSFIIRETNDHIEVNMIGNPIPSPASLCLFGIGSFCIYSRRRRSL